MSGDAEQQRDRGGRRGWWLVGALALIGAAVGAYAGSKIDPDVSELVPSLAAVGLGLGGLLGFVLLAPIGVWRAWRRRERRANAPPPPEPATLTPEPPPEPEREAVDDTPPEPEPKAPPPPPPGEEPGWYSDAENGERRYWDGHAWTEHVWRGRSEERTRKARGRR